MGQSNAHLQYSITVEDSPVFTTNVSIKQTSEVAHQDKDDFLRVEPIMIPSISIKHSPFKNLTVKDKFNNIKEVQKNSDQQLDKMNQQNGGKEKLVANRTLWNMVLHDIRIFVIVTDFLVPEDRLALSSATSRIETQMYLYKLFHLPNNWDLTFHTIENKILKQSRFSYQKMLNQSFHEQSEHSLDLDRLQSIFLPEEDRSQQISHVDKVMRAINARGISYFQGLNSIVIILVSVFPDQVAYWMACQLIQKTDNLHNDSSAYLQIMQKIDKQMKQKCKEVYEKLQKFDLGVEYFAMRWVMGLFSMDLNRALVLNFWDLILNFGRDSIVWFIVAIFKSLQIQIMSTTNGDQLNNLLKYQLKTKIKVEKSIQILKQTRILLSQQNYGEGCSYVIGQWNANNYDSINSKNFRVKNYKAMRIQFQTISEQQDELDAYETEICTHVEKQTHYQTFQSQRQLQTIKEIIKHSEQLDENYQKLLICPQSSNSKKQEGLNLPGTDREIEEFKPSDQTQVKEERINIETQIIVQDQVQNQQILVQQKETNLIYGQELYLNKEEDEQAQVKIQEKINNLADKDEANEVQASQQQDIENRYEIIDHNQQMPLYTINNENNNQQASESREQL